MLHSTFRKIPCNVMKLWTKRVKLSRRLVLCAWKMVLMVHTLDLLSLSDSYSWSQINNWSQVSIILFIWASSLFSPIEIYDTDALYKVHSDANEREMDGFNKTKVSTKFRYLQYIHGLQIVLKHSVTFSNSIAGLNKYSNSENVKNKCHITQLCLINWMSRKYYAKMYAIRQTIWVEKGKGI